MLDSARPDPDGPADVTVAAERSYAMGVALAIRFERNGSTEDARRELAAFSEAVALGGDGPGAKYRDGLGGAHQDRWRVTGEASWLDRALEEYERALAGCSMPPDELRIRRNIGNTLAARFRRSGDDQDLRDALGHLRAAAAGMPDDPRFVVSFAATLFEAYQAGGTAADLTEALQLLHRARELCPVGSADYRAVQTNLGNAIRASFARDGDLDDLDHALECHRAAVDGLCDSAPDAAIYLTMYGHALRERYAQAGDLRDLAQPGHDDPDRRLRDVEASHERDQPAQPDLPAAVAQEITEQAEHQRPCLHRHLPLRCPTPSGIASHGPGPAGQQHSTPGTNHGHMAMRVRLPTHVSSLQYYSGQVPRPCQASCRIPGQWARGVSDVRRGQHRSLSLSKRPWA